MFSTCGLYPCQRRVLKLQQSKYRWLRPASTDSERLAAPNSVCHSSVHGEPSPHPDAPWNSGLEVTFRGHTVHPLMETHFSTDRRRQTQQQRPLRLACDLGMHRAPHKQHWLMSHQQAGSSDPSLGHLHTASQARHRHRLPVFVAIRTLSCSQQSQHWGLGIHKADAYQEPGNAHSLF